MKKPAQILLVPILILLLTPATALADGMFVVPKFVWDKHKDINEPTQKAILVYDAGHEDLILQVKYEGPVDEFGWLIPVPNLPTVQKGSMRCFYELSQYTQKHFETGWQHGQARSMSKGTAPNDSAENTEPPVKVIEIKTVGAYEITVLSTKDSGALAKWLETNQFYFPTNKTDVLDAYIKQQWYFVAVKINLNGSIPFFTSRKLASGELNPLQISFASDRCVFPLKISAINSQASEVQVYVLSPEPLLERTMLEKQLLLVYSNDVARAAERARSFRELQARRMEILSLLGGLGTLPDFDEDKTFQKMSEELYVRPNELLPYAKVAKADLPDSSRWIPRLAAKSWWLTKQTWTFKPEEMRDLEFTPALSAFAGKLDSKYGYFAATGLAQFGGDAVPTLLAGFQGPDSAVRINAASALGQKIYFSENYEFYSDPRIKKAAISWLKDTEPKIRIKAVQVLTDHLSWNPKFAEALVPLLRDEDADVRYAATFGLVGLPQFHDDLRKYIPEFQEMLKDTNPVVRVSGLHMMLGMEQPIERDDLISFFKIQDRRALSRIVYYLRDRINGYNISNQEVVSLLQNTEPFARVFGLEILYQIADKQSVELALPLLNDSDQQVQLRATATLRALTGQYFTADQPDQWQQWWEASKTNFVVELHPEELRPQRRGTNDFRW